MIGSTLKLALLDHITPHEAPVLSLYLDLSPANQATAGKAFVIRAGEALKGLGLPKEYVARLTEKLKLEFARVEGRSLVIFAGEDLDELFAAYYLQTDLPFLAATDGALAHWGRPLVAPLLFVLDQRERYAVIYLAGDRVRVFEAFLGQIEELSDHVRSVDTDSWVSYRHARRSPAGGAAVAARGGADVDSFKDRLDEATARLYRSLVPEVQRILEDELTDRVILIGLPGAVSTFQRLLSPALQASVVGTLPPPPNPDAPAHEWVPLFQDLVRSTEAAHELALLDSIRESGVWGLQETLTLLQEHRLKTLVVPFGGLPDVFLTESGWVAASPHEAEVLRPGEAVKAASLLELLPELMQRTGTALEFAQGAAEERLRAEFGGMAGVKRW